MAERQQESGLIEEVIGIYFHSKVTKGGRNLSCAALVTVGDGRGRVGIGYGRAAGVPMAVEKGTKIARNKMMRVPMVGDTIAHEVTGHHASSRVILKPATPGTGVKAGGTVRAIMRAAGVHNVLSKVFGNTNAINVAKATAEALQKLQSRETVEALRGVRVNLFHPQAQEPEGAVQRPQGAAQEAEAASP